MNLPENVVKIRFMHWECVIMVHTYSNGRLALVLKDADPMSMEPDITVATVNLPHEPMNPDEVAIKDYSENEGMLDVLMQADLIFIPNRYVPSGHVEIPVCKLDTKKFKFEANSFVERL